jgi:hypothetical protein
MTTPMWASTTSGSTPSTRIRGDQQQPVPPGGSRAVLARHQSGGTARTVPALGSHVGKELLQPAEVGAVQLVVGREEHDRSGLLVGLELLLQYDDLGALVPLRELVDGGGVALTRATAQARRRCIDPSSSLRAINAPLLLARTERSPGHLQPSDRSHGGKDRPQVREALASGLDGRCHHLSARSR